MVVVVDVPDREGLRSVLLGGPFASVEKLLGQDAVVALDLAVRGVYGRTNWCRIPGRVRANTAE
jgi:hypothetical protein